MARRVSKGRQRVEMVKMKNASNLQVTFSKRRAGLFKKASELCILCGAEIVIVIFSPGDKVFSFGHPSVGTLVDRFLGRDLPPPNNDVHNQLIVAHREAGIRELNMKLMNLEGVLQMEKKYGESLREIRRRANDQWWESPIEKLNLFQLQHLKEALESLVQKVEKVAQQQQMVNNYAFPFQKLGSAWTPPNCARESSSYGPNVGAPFANRAIRSTSSIVPNH
ncbi:agamous-like MADS-box protein AGL62 [Solanum pennellii]|uniref:Agamous-like MADS-box protein AGL62 n=1 Tax=Solanum pennellii TaxID=28526 RepID=A0ABM1H9Q4_SOLPN|nr:agamous-like MADS-box protein AGL62 [Solanum pennellii]